MKLKPKLLALCISSCLAAGSALPMAHAEDAAAPKAAPVDAPPVDAPPVDTPAPVVMPLAINTVGGVWLVQGEFEGKATIEAERLLLHFDRGRLMMRAGIAATKRQIVSIAPQLRKKSDKGTFDISGKGAPLTVGRELSTEAPLDLGALDFTIPLDKGLDLSQHFLTLELQMLKTMPDGTTGPSLIYIIGPEDIFTPKP